MSVETLELTYLGSGKTAICKQLQLAGFNVLDEAFLDMPSFSIHPQTLVMETIWISHWVTRLLEKDKQHKEAFKHCPTVPEQVFFADRSPYSAVFYAPNGQLLEPLITRHIEELKMYANIQIITVYVEVERNLLWSRIKDRLAREPHRVKYNEDSKEWMDTTLAFYEDNADLWDFVIQNNENSISDLMLSLVAKLNEQLPGTSFDTMLFSAPRLSSFRSSLKPFKDISNTPPAALKRECVASGM